MHHYGQMSEYSQLDRLYYNLRPEYQRYIRRSEVRSVIDLINLANDYERILIQKKLYKPPPLPPDSLMPEIAYKLEKDRSKRRKKKSCQSVPNTSQENHVGSVEAQVTSNHHVRINGRNPASDVAKKASGQRIAHARIRETPRGSEKELQRWTDPSNQLRIAVRSKNSQMYLTTWQRNSSREHRNTTKR